MSLATQFFQMLHEKPSILDRLASTGELEQMFLMVDNKQQERVIFLDLPDTSHIKKAVTAISMGNNITVFHPQEFEESRATFVAYKDGNRFSMEMQQGNRSYALTGRFISSKAIDALSIKVDYLCINDRVVFTKEYHDNIHQKPIVLNFNSSSHQF